MFVVLGQSELDSQAVLKITRSIADGFRIVSIDVAETTSPPNIGANLQGDQAAPIAAWPGT